MVIQCKEKQREEDREHGGYKWRCGGKIEGREASNESLDKE